MTLRLPAELDTELPAAAAEDHRSVKQAVVHAIETYLGLRPLALSFVGSAESARL